MGRASTYSLEEDKGVVLHIKFGPTIFSLEKGKGILQLKLGLTMKIVEA